MQEGEEGRNASASSYLWRGRELQLHFGRHDKKKKRT